VAAAEKGDAALFSICVGMNPGERLCSSPTTVTEGMFHTATRMKMNVAFFKKFYFLTSNSSGKGAV